MAEINFSPQIIRNNYRNLVNFLIWFPRLVVVILIVIMLGTLVSKQSSEIPNRNNLKTNSSLNLKVAKASEEYSANQNEANLEKFISEVETALGSGDNPYLLRLLAKVNKEGQNLIDYEIEKTEKIVLQRPDYKTAWLRLAFLYESAGYSDLADEIREDLEK